LIGHILLGNRLIEHDIALKGRWKVRSDRKTTKKT